MSVAKDAARQVKAAARATGPWMAVAARLGYAAKGVVYLTMGLLALQAVRGAGPAQVDQQSAMQTVLVQPYGRVLLGILAVGLVAYALWRFTEAALDPEHEGKRTKAVLKRIGYAVTGVGYALLAASAFYLLSGTGSQQNGNPRDATARLMAQPFGPYLVGLAGLIVLGVGVLQFYQAYSANFERNFKDGELSADQRAMAIRLGRFGYAAKGVVLSLIGLFLLRAAWMYDPNQAGGLGDALATLAAQPYGEYLLALVATGLLAYGIYALVLAAFRRLPIYV